MDRRTFIAALATLLVARLDDARAQPVKRRVGFVSNGSQTAPSPQIDAFRGSLRDLGWIEGRNLEIEYRWAESDPDRLPALVAEFAKSKVDVIVLSGTQAIRAAQKTTPTIPVVFVLLTDPSALGFVPSLRHPGGNMTGVASQFEQLITKQLQLMKEALPGLSTVGLLHRSGETSVVLNAAEEAARRMDVVVRKLQVAGPTEFEAAFKKLRVEQDSAMLVLPSPYFAARRAQLIELAARYRMPACYEYRTYVEEGGLMSYGPGIDAMFARAATYVDRILRGAKPGDLPVEQPSKFELTVNLRTAKALGLVIPQALLVRADAVIE
jgi:putative ABC transport system substrate-binding protein